MNKQLMRKQGLWLHKAVFNYNVKANILDRKKLFEK